MQGRDIHDTSIMYILLIRPLFSSLAKLGNTNPSYPYLVKVWCVFLIVEIIRSRVH